jgi:hypothetical protein
MDNQQIDLASLINEQNPVINEPKPKKKLLKKFLIVTISILLAAVIPATLTLSETEINPEYCVVYTKSDGTYFYRTDIKKSIKFDVKTRNSEEYIRYYGFSSTDSQKFIYTAPEKDHIYNLYYKSIGIGFDSISDPVLVARNVSDIYGDQTYFLKNILFYQSFPDHDLYMYDGTEPVKLASKVNEYIVNKAADRVIFTDQESNLYQINIGKSATRIESNVKCFLCSSDLSHTYFIKDDTLYDKPFNKNIKEIAKGDINLHYSYITDDGIYYTVIPEDKKSCYDFVYDPDPSDENLKYIREKLKNTNFYIDIYYYNNKKTRLIADHAHEFVRLSEVYYSSKKVYDFCYSKIDTDNFQKPNISNVTNIYDTNRFLVNIETDPNELNFADMFIKKYHVLVDTKDYALEDNFPLAVSPDKKYVYYKKPIKVIDSLNSEQDFCKANLRNISSTEILIDKNIDNYGYIPTKNGDVYYTKVSQLYISGNKALSSYTLLISQEEPLITLSYENNKIGKLTVVENGKVNFINENVIKYSAPHPKNGKNIFFTEAVDNNNSEGTLKHYNYGNITQIDSNVIEIYDTIPLS